VDPDEDAGTGTTVDGGNKTSPKNDAGTTTSQDSGSQTVQDSGSDAPPINTANDCIIISEYVEGSASNKALELFNCGSSPVNLSAYGLCLESNATTTSCTISEMLKGTLAAGAVRVICGSSFSNSACNQSSGVVNFNGDDRIALFRDSDNSGSINRGSDTIVDSFGQLGSPPSGTPWADMTLRRTSCSPYTGSGPFNAASLYSTHNIDDFTHLGVKPSISCP
jgi:hypothetical protein